MCVSMRVTKHLIPDKLNKQVVTDSYLHCSFAPVVHLTVLNVSHYGGNSTCCVWCYAISQLLSRKQDGEILIKLRQVCLS